MENSDGIPPADELHLPQPLTAQERYDSRFWQLGTNGSANIVTYDGDDIVGVLTVQDPELRAQVIDAHNRSMRRAIEQHQLQAAKPRRVWGIE